MTGPTFHGSCHCGNIAFDLHWPDATDRIPARACQCTFCRKHGAAWTSHPDGQLAVTVRDPSRVERYAFGTHTADFHVCGTCGVMPVATCRIGGRTYGLANVTTLEDGGFDDALFDRSTSNFDGETTDDRLARREARWIGSVTFER